MPALRGSRAQRARARWLSAYRCQPRRGRARSEHARRPRSRGALLREAGFDLLRSRAEQLSEQIKSSLADYVEHLRTARAPLTASAFLGDRFAATYSHLSKVFSRTTNLTIEKYLIRLKIERVKEMLSYGELNLNQIADELRYSSGQHLSNQFRQVTGVSVTDFRRMLLPERMSLDALG